MTESFHTGEIAVQELAGERSEAILNGRMIWRAIPSAARSFVRQQSYVAMSWLSASDAPWASFVVADPGFASCDDSGTVLTIRTRAIAAAAGPPLDGIRAAGALGLLFIDLATRRRLRVNGAVERCTDGELRVAIAQAFPNCPKYIQAREVVAAGAPILATSTTSGTGVPDDVAAWLSRTDTAFVASVGPDGSLDCSHRGGRRGYMRMHGDTVVVPDYPGNSMFCTLGNLMAVPRAGMVLVDFDAHRQLHLTGDASIEIARDEERDLTGGSGRWWSLRPRRWTVSPLASATRLRLVDESPFNPPVEP